VYAILAVEFGFGHRRFQCSARRQGQRAPSRSNPPAFRKPVLPWLSHGFPVHLLFGNQSPVSD
jgi:hypothetical protein